MKTVSLPSKHKIRLTSFSSRYLHTLSTNYITRRGCPLVTLHSLDFQSTSSSLSWDERQPHVARILTHLGTIHHAWRCLISSVIGQSTFLTRKIQLGYLLNHSISLQTDEKLFSSLLKLCQALPSKNYLTEKLVKVLKPLNFSSDFWVWKYLHSMHNQKNCYRQH